MTSEEKAMEIVNCNKCPYDRHNCKHNKDTWCHEYRMALEMAQWKDRQFKEYLEKKKAKYKINSYETDLERKTQIKN